jgi:MSHA pilin protein MshC
MRIGHSKGFTLVELVATLIIIALIAAVSGSRFFTIGAFQQQGFFDETISAVRYAQKLAVATNCTVRVQITATGYTLFRPATNGAACTAGTYTTPVTDPTGSTPTFTRTAPGSVTLTPADFTFASDGSASANVTVSVSGGRSFNVIAATGFVQRQ